MTWTSPTNRTTGDIVTAGQWNQFLGAGGNFVHLFDGTRFNADLVYELSLASGNAAIEGAILSARSAETGGLRWLRLIDNPMYWIGRG